LTLVAGNLYGTTANGGTTVGDNNGSGTVFELTPPAHGDGLWTETVLYTFEGYNVTPADQANPYGGVVFDPQGDIYGCTTGGAGGVYELTPPVGDGGAWSETKLHTFNNYGEGYGCIDVTFDSAGDLYGANPSSLADEDGGTLFKLTPPTIGRKSWRFAVLHTFGPNAHNPNWFRGGAQPSHGLMFDNATSTLYGMTANGGDLSDQVGVVFSFGPAP
jgi:hypothetical protein